MGDVHQDAVLLGEEQSIILHTLQAEKGWSAGATCDWTSQLSLLVCLSLPPGGGGLEYYTATPQGAELSIEGHDVDHEVGKAILLESRRPHNLRAFAASDVDGLQPRLVLHAFILPCRASPGADPELLILG